MINWWMKIFSGPFNFFKIFKNFEEKVFAIFNHYLQLHINRFIFSIEACDEQTKRSYKYTSRVIKISLGSKINFDLKFDFLERSEALSFSIKRPSFRIMKIASWRGIRLHGLWIKARWMHSRSHHANHPNIICAARTRGFAFVAFYIHVFRTLFSEL